MAVSAIGNLYTSTIPANIAANDVSNNVSRFSLFSTTNSDEYLGTVIHDPAILTTDFMTTFFVDCEAILLLIPI